MIAAWVFWLTIALVLVVAGLSVGRFFFLCFAFGCFAGLLANLAGSSGAVQAVWFLGTTLVFFILGYTVLRQYTGVFEDAVRRVLWKGAGMSVDSGVATNVDRFIGRAGVVTKEIPARFGRGYVRIAGEQWPALSGNGKVINVDSAVVVRAVEGSAVVVEPEG